MTADQIDAMIVSGLNTLSEWGGTQNIPACDDKLITGLGAVALNSMSVGNIAEAAEVLSCVLGAVYNIGRASAGEVRQ